MHEALQAGGHAVLDATYSVLVVDDDDDDRLLITDLLESTPSVASVDAVASFAEGREAIFERRHDVYLIDCRLGARNGLELIAESSGRASGPFIILTGLSDPEVDRQAAAFGAYDYLDKHGLDVERLARAIRYSTSLWRANHQLARRSERQASLARLSRHAVDVVDLDSFLPVALNTVLDALDAECAVIAMFDEDGTSPTVWAGTCGASTFGDGYPSVTRVIADGTPWGTLSVHSHGSRAIEPEDVTFVEAVTNLIAAVVDRAEASAARDRLAEILEASPDIAGTIGLDGVVTYLNRAARDLFGLAEGDAYPGIRYDGVQPSWASEILEMEGYPEAVAHGWWSGRTAFLDADGNEVPVAQAVIVHRDAQGDPTHFSTVAHDLSRHLAAEKALSESQALVTKAFSESPIGKLIISPEGIVVSANRAIEELVGCGPADLLGRAAATMVHPDDLDQIRSDVETGFDDAASRVSREVRLMTDAGDERWVFATLSVITGAQAEIEHLVVQVQDIAAEKAATERIAFQASLLDQVHNAVIATDLEGRVTYWNRSAEEMLGWSADEALGRSVFDLVMADADGASDATAGVARALAETGKWEGEGILRRKDGTTLVAFMSDSLFHDDAGRPVGIVGIKADVTHLRAMESEARRHETMASSVLRSVHFPVAVIDPAGTVTAVNRAWTQFAIENGGDPDTTGVGANYLEACLAAGEEPGAREALAGIRSVLEGREPSFALEYECSAPGDERWFEMEVQPIPGEGAVVVHWNITAEHLHRRALQETIDAKDRFIASISHELRTPLTAVVGLAEELRSGGIEPGEAHEFQTLIAEQARELSLLVEDLLIAARLDSDTLTFRPDTVDLRREVDHVLAPWLSETTREIRCSIEHGVTVWADPGRVRQILRNLVSNAIRHGAEPVEVQATTNGSHVTVAVRDHGPGIPEEARERMFEPYATFGGTDGLAASVGLGLHVSRDLASRMGGTIEYRREGGVTTFSLILPTASARNGSSTAIEPVEATRS